MPIQELNHNIRFLVTCAKETLLEEDKTYITTFIKQNEFDFKQLISLADVHGVVPLLYHTLKHLPSENINQRLLEKIKQKYTYITQINMRMSVELLNIIILLSKHDIPSLVYKGPSLALAAYGDLSLRQFGDLDILIPKRDRSKILDLFIKSSYTAEITLTQENKKLFFDTTNVLGFHKNSNNTRIEVHWELLSRNYAIDWDHTILWDTAESIIIHKQKIPILASEQLLLYLCAHGSKHLFERLAWICDIDRMVRTHPNLDWEYIQKHAKRLGIERILYLSLSLTKLLFALPLPIHIETKIVEDKNIPKITSQILDVNFQETIATKKGYSTFFILISMRERYSDKLRFAWCALFLIKFDDFNYIQLPKPLHFLYPLIRVWRLVSKYLIH